MGTMSVFRVFIGLALIGLLSMGMTCPGIDANPEPNAKCVKQYTKCQLPSGPLGVCDIGKCSPGETPPCLLCMPQH